MKGNAMITATKTIPAVAYLRRSTDRQEQSIADQRAEIVRWAGEHSYRIVREFVDDAISGTSADERPAFQKMIADAQRGEFRAVVVWNSDRFSRGDVCETEYFRYLLRQAGVKVESVTEDFLTRDGIEGDVLRTVRQAQNRHYSVSLALNTLRGQISAVMAQSDPGRAAPFGYDREILAPDGSVMFRIRFCPGRVREVYDKDGKLQARYAKGQSLKKPGKQCKAQLVVSDPQRVQIVRDIYRKCLDGVGFASIAADLNARGIPAPCQAHWNFTTVKAILENPTYCGNLVWNRRTEAKFYQLQNGRAKQRRRQAGEAKVVKTPKDDWIIIPDAVPAIVSREDWEKAQVLVAKRRRAVGGAGHRNRRWLLTGVLECGDCGHKFWGAPCHKGRIAGRAAVVTNYYKCAGRRSHGKTICATPSTLRAEQLESWVLGKLRDVILMDEDAVDEAIERFVKTVARYEPGDADATRAAREIKQINDTVTALTTHIDPANLGLLNDRLTQLRLRKECLERELHLARKEKGHSNVDTLRTWARNQLTGLHDAMAGTRDDRTRDVIATYVDRITVWPSQRRGEMRLNPAAAPLWKRRYAEPTAANRDRPSRSDQEHAAHARRKRHDRPEGRSRGNPIGATGFEPATS
ncbi:MAG: recombinase family protein [Phycisphaerae bacterium]